VGKERPVCKTIHRGLNDQVEHGLYVPGRVQGVPVEFLIDSGAIISIISSKVYKAIPGKVRPGLRRWINDTVTADGIPLVVQGVA
jgi:hypothetical protein